MEEEMAIDAVANEDLISDNEYIIEEDENSDENQVNELEEGYEMDNDYNESQDAQYEQNDCIEFHGVLLILFTR